MHARALQTSTRTLHRLHTVTHSVSPHETGCCWPSHRFAAVGMCSRYSANRSSPAGRGRPAAACTTCRALGAAAAPVDRVDSPSEEFQQVSMNERCSLLRAGAASTCAKTCTKRHSTARKVHVNPWLRQPRTGTLKQKRLDKFRCFPTPYHVKVTQENNPIPTHT